MPTRRLRPCPPTSWNFTAAPGWTKEEAQILKLCLMRHGVGRWVQILDTGLLPGKMIQQLNGQTQRLLGQQSLAAYTGLQVDVDRIRADNERLAGAERKNGLVINSGREWVLGVRQCWVPLGWQARRQARVACKQGGLRSAVAGHPPASHSPPPQPT